MAETKIIIERAILTKIRSWFGKEKILILKGARQVGKTTILKQIKQELEQNKQKAIYFSLDAEISNPIFKEPRLFIKFLEDQFADAYLYVLLDEFQYLDQAGVFLKVVFDELKAKVQLIISGSSSLEITKNTEFLTGRKIEFSVATFNFKEYLTAKTSLKLDQIFNLANFQELRDFNQIYSNQLQTNFVDYLTYGGYPEVVLETNSEHKELILKELITTYLQKDISGFLKIENISGFNNLIRVLAAQIGNLVNKSELSNTLNLSYETLNKYLDMLAGTYVFNFVSPFAQNVRKELAKMPKIFINDLGIKKIVLREGTQLDYDFIAGSAIENYVYLGLKQQFDADNIYFYRTISKSEIDFVVQNQEKLILIESKFTNKVSLNIPKAFAKFVLHYPNIEAEIILTKNTLDFDKEKNLFLLPVYLWEFLKLN